MKKICFLPYDEKRGTIYHLVDLLEEMGKQNKYFEIYIITLNKEQIEGLNEKLKKFSNIYKNFNVIFINSSYELEKLKLLGNIDLVHCNAYRQTRVLLKIKRKHNYSFSICLSMHSFMNGTWMKTLFSNIVSLLIINKIDLVHFLSYNSREEFLKYNFFFSRKVLDITFPLGCNPDEFIKPIEPDGYIKELLFKEYDKQKFNIIYLANFTSNKNHIWFIKLIRPLILNNGNLKIWFFGDGKLLDKTKKIVSKYNLKEFFVFPGRIDRRYVAYVLKHMDLAISVSKSENAPHSLLEPLFAGIPVITFNVGTASMLILDFVTGFNIKKKNDILNYRSKLNLLIQNKSLLHELGKNAKEFVFNYFTWSKIASLYIQTYTNFFVKV